MHRDKRGTFRKIFNSLDFCTENLDFQIQELYYSVNNKNAIRGMHFQIPPADHAKIVYVISGCITDVCIDLRKGSNTFGQYFCITLDDIYSKYLFIPKGFAHGFSVHADDTIVHYAQTTCHQPDYDNGIKYDSFGYKWNIENPIVSDRDLQFPALSDFKTPFIL